MVKEKFEFHLTTRRLRGLYKRHGIRHCRAKTVMRAATKAPESKKQERADFAKKVVSAMADERRIIFADETSYRVTDFRRVPKTWQNPNAPLRRIVNTQGLSGCTLYGACSNFDMPLQFMLYSTTNTNGWINFLWQLNEELEKLHIPGKVLIITDNHAAHTTPRSMQHYGKLTLFKLPSYCK